tara:strand:+ start:337 stop:783 length:447 start_codon:yes stop_codon:yes gene_type:complete
MKKNSGLILSLFLNINIVLAENNLKVDISDLWISEAPPTMSVLVAYVTLKNNSEIPLSLTSISCPLFSSIEIHRSIVKNDIVSMERYSALEIPSKSSIKLSPGDYHLMLFNPEKPLRIGDTPVFIFSFSDGTQIPVTAAIRKRSSSEK